MIKIISIIFISVIYLLTINECNCFKTVNESNYEYYTSNGIQSGLNADQTYFLLNGRNITILSGAFHYFRVHNSQWRDRLQKMRAVGLNTVETYVPWNLHELHPGSYDFGDGGSDFEEFLDIKKFLTLAQEEDLFVILRPGPYICAEWDFGGLPSWLLRNSSMKIRTNDSVYINYVSKYFKVLLGLIEPLQFTKGGSIIAVQIENEYGHIRNEDKSYLRSIIQILRDNNVVELLFTSDTLKSKTAGALPGEYLMTANFNDDAKSNLDTLKTYQSNKPNMVMEYYAGWYDQINEEHNTLDLATYKRVYTDILTYPASVNIYMFVGGTNFGFTAGASDASSDMNNAGLQPVTTSYDYDAPISECGDLTDKYFATADMIGNYSRQKFDLSIGPIDPNRTSYRDIEIKEQILLSEIINNFTDIIESENVMPMELLPINNNSGQNFGYVVYRKKYINLTANAVLKISGYVRDHVLVLVNDLLINPVLSHPDDLNKFGFWRLKDSTIVLTDKDIENATVDLVVENNSRNNYGSLDQFQQYKGLTDDVFIDNEPIRNWQIMPLEFKKSWNLQLSGWHPIITKEATPALYRVTFEAKLPLLDTFVDVQNWRKGIVIVNGFVLGRHFAVGPQLTLYLPGGLLREGTNEIIIFEHFTASDKVSFTVNNLWGVGYYLTSISETPTIKKHMFLLIYIIYFIFR